MRFEFYRIEAGEFASVQFHVLESASLEAPKETATHAVNDRFQDLIASNSEIGQIVVVSPSMGDPPGNVVAVETVNAWPSEILQRQGRPTRQLAWIVDPLSTGLR